VAKSQKIPERGNKGNNPWLNKRKGAKFRKGSFNNPGIKCPFRFLPKKGKNGKNSSCLGNLLGPTFPGVKIERQLNYQEYAQ